MRFCFLVNGMTGYLDAQYRALAQLGNELLIVSPGSGEAAGGPMADTAFHGLQNDDYARQVRWQTPPDPAELLALVKEFDPDAIVMSSWAYCKAYRAVMKQAPSTVVRALYLDNLWRGTPRQWLGRFTRRLYIAPVADCAMVASDRTEYFARQLGFGPADVIRGSHCADVELFASPPRSGAELVSRRRFLYVGRLVDHKGADVLADAYRRYHASAVDPWQLDVVGTGPLDPLLRSQPGVVMHGFLQPSEVAELMRNVSCFVLTSHVEPYGVVVHEAAAAGLPILCTHFSGAAPTMVQDGANGWIVPAGDIPRWVDAMARMAALPAERLAAMSDTSRAISLRMSPATWALNLHEEIARRKIRMDAR